MIRTIVVSLVALASAANAQTCVYKSVMSDAEIQACKEYQPAVEPPAKPQPKTEPVKAKPKTAKEVLGETAALLAKIEANNAAKPPPAPQEPYIGMTDTEALTITDSASFARSRRLKVNVTETAYGKHEQWVYGSRYSEIPDAYLYFANGKLTSIQK